nr:hypothetical protein [Tanacetum cinerariifolium]
MGYSFYYLPENKDLVDTPLNGKTIGSKWLFKKKTNIDGHVHTYKARLVAKGYTQTLRIDYEETFSPIADIRAIRILIAIAAFYDYDIWQMNVKTAFLNGYLFEEVYMEQPKDVKFYLGRCFAMKDLGEAVYILGINIYRDKSWRLIGLCQSAYIKKILKRYHMENSKRRSIPMQDKLRLSKSQSASTPAELKRMKNVPYASTVGSIMYAVRCTRHDVAFAQNITSRFQQDDLHWTTVKNILKYLRNTKDMFLVYRVVVDWKSAKQSIFATSSVEAEYIVAYDAFKESVWVKNLFLGLYRKFKTRGFYDVTNFDENLLRSAHRILARASPRNAGIKCVLAIRMICRMSKIKVKEDREFARCMGVLLKEMEAAYKERDWEPQFIFSCRREITEDLRLAKEINALCARVIAIVDQREMFVNELDMLARRHVPDKMADFMKQVSGKDIPNLMKLQILGREFELRA